MKINVFSRILNKIYINLSIRSKIVISFVIIILVMCGLNIVMMVTSLNYNNQYSQIVTNITMANSINGSFRTNIDSAMWDIVAGKKNFEDGQQHKIIKNANECIYNIKQNVTSQEDKMRLDVILRTIKTLNYYVDVMGKQIEQKKKVAENEKVLEDIRGVSDLIEEEIQEFILYELKASEKVNQQIQKGFNSWVATNIIVLCIIVLFSIAAIWIISGSISNPIRELCKSTTSISEGNFDVRVQSKNYDEIATLSNSFNKMVVKIKELLDNSIKEQELIKKSELKVLQAQINPHFLYNTLDTIVWMADSNQNEEVIEIVTALSSFFRITLSKGNDWITVREEVKHINSYLIIQKIRYSDILNFEIQVDEAIYDCKILKLTLQPIVENALYHGIKNKRMGGIIKVRGSKKNDHIVFEVTDNGIGMTENKVNELVNEMKDTKEAIIKESGFGLNNVHKRIILYYGKEYGVNIQSEFQKGTKLTITIPVCVD